MSKMMRRKPVWNGETMYALNLYKTFLGLIGVWPFGVENLSSKLRWFLAILIQVSRRVSDKNAMVETFQRIIQTHLPYDNKHFLDYRDKMSTISSLSLEVYRHCVDLDDTMDAFLMDLSSLVSISKLFLTRVNYRHTRSLVSSIVEDLSILDDTSQREIVMKYTTRGRIVSAAILYLGYASGMSFVFRTLPFNYVLSQNIDRNETYDVKLTSYFLSTYCVFDDQSGLWRAAILLLQTMQIFVNATSHCGNDGFFFGIAMHLCGQFEVLRMNFANLENEKSSSCKKIGALVRRHCHLIRLSDYLEEAFNVIILIQLLMSALLLCIEGFQMLVSLDANDIIATIKHAVIIVTLLVQIFIYSYAGDMLESKSADLVFGVYDSPWYTFDARVIKNLAFVIFYGRIPRQVTAGKFVSMNFFTFKEIIKASASYISVLRVAL